MTKKDKILLASDTLKELYPKSECALKHSKPYELMIAARLSAQCTDARVNIVTEKLFVKYPTLEAFAAADVEELGTDIRSCGLYKTKAKSIVEMANQLIERHGGEIPDTMEELVALSGVGRKIANLILGDVFGKPAVVADTHFIRITGRLGFTESENPEKVEMDLRKLLPEEGSSDFCHRIVWFGREVCRARNPDCENCLIRKRYKEQSGRDLKCKIK